MSDNRQVTSDDARQALESVAAMSQAAERRGAWPGWTYALVVLCLSGMSAFHIVDKPLVSLAGEVVFIAPLLIWLAWGSRRHGAVLRMFSTLAWLAVPALHFAMLGYVSHLVDDRFGPGVAAPVVVFAIEALAILLALGACAAVDRLIRAFGSGGAYWERGS